jgi:alkanesulfonate monooxygenase SsuD/methylene tetrahydromethanopterin reductase-like flavin-dependent oxidoreductase (luciferase family)
MAPIQFGLVLPPGPRGAGARATFLADSRRALDLVGGHFDSAWFIDHFQFDNLDVLECWTTLSYLAALHPALRFGAAVLGQSYRNPALLAKMAASFQVLTGGRLILGLGAGWKEDGYRAYGYDFPSAGVRVSQLEEALAIIRALWTEERATVIGRHYRVEGARCDPKPEPLPPIMVGAKRPRMLRVAARHADWWNPDWIGLDGFRTLAGQLDVACEEVGRDPTTLRKTWLGACACGRTEAAARAELAVSYGAAFANIMAASLVGTPVQVVEQLRAYMALGVDYFILYPHRFPDLASLELLCGEVLPALRTEASRGG